MALVNFTLPFGNSLPIQSPWTTIGPLQRHATAINNMLYDPAGHQQTGGDDGGNGDDYYDDEYRHDPYAPPAKQQQPPPLIQRSTQPQQSYRRSNDYLPPVTNRKPQQQPQPPQQRQFPASFNNLYLPLPPSPSVTQTHKQQQQPQYYNQYGQQPSPPQPSQQPDSLSPPYRVASFPQTQLLEPHRPRPSPASTTNVLSGPSRSGGGTGLIVDGEGVEHATAADGGFPSQQPTYTRVQAGGAGGRTQVHAVLDYDDDGTEEDNDDDDSDDGKTYKMPTVTPIQGPIFLKNGSVPVVPLFSYPTLRNGSFVQIPIWWTALSVALGLEVRGDVIRGAPCVKRHNQLFCPTAGTSYPINRIESFIDENKALMRRMYGDFEMSTQYGPPSSSAAGSGKRKRQTDEFGVPDFVGPPGSDMDEIPLGKLNGDGGGGSGDSYFSKWRSKRQSNGRGSNGRNGSGSSGGNGAGPTPPNEKVTGRLDACESKIEIVTPYWASNSAGKVRAIVNTQHFEQAIHQEVCTKTQTGRCGGDCGCEQKYKWHRLLAYDPDNDCRGIFMDWFLFPSCCVCRCDP